jgi:hypothetical protein
MVLKRREKTQPRTKGYQQGWTSEEEAGTGLTDTSLGKVGEGLSSLLLLVKVMVTPRMTPTTRSRARAAQSQNLLSFLPNGENAAAWS